MQIADVLLALGRGSFFYDDQAAIREGREHDGVAYLGTPVTPGFIQVLQPATALSIGLVLEDGAVIWGDMVSVQYSGAAGRDPLFDPGKIEAVCREVLFERLIGLDAAQGAANCARALAFTDTGRLPLAIEYSVSQLGSSQGGEFAA